MYEESFTSLPGVSRRDAVMRGVSAVAASAMSLAVPRALSAETVSAAVPRSTLTESEQRESHLSPGVPGRDYAPVTTPNGVALPWKAVDGVKVYHLVAEAVQHRSEEHTSELQSL